MKYALIVGTLSLAVALFGCEKSQDKPTPKENAKPVASKANEPSHEGHDHTAEVKTPAPGGHGGPVIELGTTKIGEFDLRASRDKVEFKPGGDAPIDVWIDGGVGKGVTAVRFWIGTQDAKGSIKAKAEVEDGKWHTHVEIPSPTPPGTMLWVEIDSNGQKALASFDLKI